MTEDDISAVRKRAWETRRAKYGPKGHRGGYARPVTRCTNCERLITALVKMHADEDLSEGQVARMTGLDRIEIRRRADEFLKGRCIDGYCRSPVACEGFGYCRSRNENGLPDKATAARWRLEWLASAAMEQSDD